MPTLLQTLLVETLDENTDPILRQFIDTVLPAMERAFGSISALGGSEDVHFDRLTRMGDAYAAEKSKRWAASADQSLLVHVLNGLLTAWNLLPLMSDQLSDDEKRLLCLGLTLHDYNKYCQGEEEDSPKAYEVESILELCGEMGEKLSFDSFWGEWRSHLAAIGYLAQNTQGKCGTNLPLSNWPDIKTEGHRLMSPLRHLLSFGDVAVHMTNPAEIITTTRGKRLTEKLRRLDIDGKLVYHRLRNTTGLLSNGIHNAVLAFSAQQGWHPLLFFAQGTVYLAPKKADLPDKEILKEALWDSIEQLLSQEMLQGNVGFIRDGKGVKNCSQALELFTAEQIIRQAPSIITANVGNKKEPATPKRLARINLSKAELERLLAVADLRSDRLAELIGFLQKNFFSKVPDFTTWILERLKIHEFVSVEQAEFQNSGTKYGLYQVAAEYISRNSELNEEDLTSRLEEITHDLVIWSTEKKLLFETANSSKEVFSQYVEQYLEVYGWAVNDSSFRRELENYEAAKTKAAKQPICSLSSGELLSEDQVDSVVLFKQQQYSNKNPLGGGQIKRGISKIWSLEMLLRQAKWAVPAGKMEDQQKPVFLYMYPAYVYSPQVAQSIRVLINTLKRVNFWDIHKFWLANGLSVQSLQEFSWLSEPEPEAGRFSTKGYGKQDLPFMGISYTTTRGKTVTDAWAEPAFLSLIISRLLGIKVVATASQTPLYSSDSDFRESVKLDGPANFWSVLGLPESLHLEEIWKGRVQRVDDFLERLMIVYSVHLDTQSEAPDPRWRALPDTARQVVSNVLNLFSLKQSNCRKRKRDPTQAEVSRYWRYAQLWSKGDSTMEKQLSLVKRLAEEYRQFYRVRSSDSSHAVLLPLTKALDTILSVPPNTPTEDLILEGAGQLRDAIKRQKPYHRPIWVDKSVDVNTRIANELTAIHTFMTTCVEDLFREQYKSDLALLQENRNRIKSGVSFAYQMLELQDSTEKTSVDDNSK